MSSHSPRATPSHGIKSLLPFLMAMLAAVLTTLSYGVSLGADATPSITLIVVFFWISRRPALLPPLVILVIGLWHDALVGAPIGLTPLLLLAVRAAIVEQNIIIFSQSFILGWIGYAALCSLITLVEWIVVSWMHGALLAGSPFVVQAVLGIVVYPLIAGLCGWLDYVIFGIRKG
jgi:rod shape-determining protein MreD